MTYNSPWLAGVGGLATVSTTAAVRSLHRHHSPPAGEDFDLLDHDRSRTVITTDGVPLAVREFGPADAPLTVVFAHGFCMALDTYHFQRSQLARQWGDDVRMVFYDHRGHGRSGHAPGATYTIERLGRDLDEVLSVTAPTGPVVLVGHSMGGMTILSHARQFPRHYGPRVVGAALISTAAQGVFRSPLGGVLRNPALGAMVSVARRSPGLATRARDSVRSLISPVLRAGSYGDEAVSPGVAALSERMIHSTAIITMAGFVDTLRTHDERDGLAVLAAIPTTVMCGDRDLLMTVDHSREMAEAMSHSELITLLDAGHLALMEQPQAVTAALVRLADRVKAFA